MKHSERSIQNALARYYHSKGYTYLGFNAHLYKWECDFVAVNDKLYVTEVEVKCYRSDFLRDKKKSKFQTLFTGFFNYRHPNYMLYACPVGMILADELPRHVGLIYVKPDGVCIMVKKPKVMHRGKASVELLLHVGRSCARYLVRGI